MGNHDPDSARRLFTGYLSPAIDWHWGEADDVVGDLEPPERKPCRRLGRLWRALTRRLARGKSTETPPSESLRDGFYACLNRVSEMLEHCWQEDREARIARCQIRAARVCWRALSRLEDRLRLRRRFCCRIDISFVHLWYGDGLQSRSRPLPAPSPASQSGAPRKRHVPSPQHPHLDSHRQEIRELPLHRAGRAAAESRC